MHSSLRSVHCNFRQATASCQKSRMNVLHCVSPVSQPLHSRLHPENINNCCKRLSYRTFKAKLFKSTAPQQDKRSNQLRRTRSEAVMGWQACNIGPDTHCTWRFPLLHLFQNLV